MIKKSNIILACTFLALTACGGSGYEKADPNPTPVGLAEGPGVLSGESGNLLDAFSGKSRGGLFGGDGTRSVDGGGLAVNAFLWRAALETVDFLPLQSVDSNGGVIITDWATKPNDASERIKASVFIFGTKLSPEAVDVKIFRQKRSETAGDWVDVKVEDGTTRQIENAILTRARSLKVAASQKR